MLMNGRAIVDRIELNDRDAETSVDLRNALGRLDCRVALYLTGLEQKGFEKKKYESLQSIADTFVMETQKFSSVALELKFGGSEEADDAAPADKKLEDDDAAGKEDDAATTPPRASATRTSAELSSVKYIAHEKGYRVDAMVKTKDETGEVWRIQTVDEDFCELMSIPLVGIAETKRLKTATLYDNWIVHKKAARKKVITFLSSFRLPN